MDLNVLIMMNVPMVTIIAMLSPLAPITMVFSRALGHSGEGYDDDCTGIAFTCNYNNGFSGDGVTCNDVNNYVGGNKFRCPRAMASVMASSVWIMNVSRPKITVAHPMQFVLILTVHIPAHVMSVTKAKIMTVSGASIMTIASKTLTTAM